MLKYGCEFPKSWDEVQIEQYAIQQGGLQEGLFFHYKQMQSLLWPDDFHNRWTDLILTEVLEHGKKEDERPVIALMGPGSSGKTHAAAKYALTDYYCHSDNTAIIISSTTLQGLERRVWGEIKSMHRSAKKRFQWLPGHTVDHMHVLTTDELDSEDEENIRDIRRGIICIACLSSSGQYQGLGSYVGLKQERLRFIADESQFMAMSFMEAQANFIHNPDYKFLCLGNPNPTTPDNPLHQAAEPKDGWHSIPDDGKTKTWDTKFFNGRCINLDGLDSPNNDFPGDKPKWPKITNRRTLRLIEQTYTKESNEWYSQGRGVLRLGVAGRNVITMELCEQHNAMGSLTWKTEEQTKIGFLDAAYGGVGGDRCVLGWLEFGQCVDNITRILVHPLIIVPVRVIKEITPEDQIAEFCKGQMEQFGVEPSNFFFDARGSVATAFGRIWSPLVNTVEFGGKPTDRIVSESIFIEDERGRRRPKLANEHFSKFVSELWFSVRYVVEADQMRGLPREAILDGAPREYKEVKDHKQEVETKKDMKKRTNKSPDLFDAIVTGVEGARRRGFEIAKVARQSAGGPNRIKDWFDKMRKEKAKLAESYVLTR